ncbi:hypothetical protein [Limnothrix sp. FACHB-881]|nr:hypothetical protein [Limnothrix sp. FACHB-881]
MKTHDRAGQVERLLSYYRDPIGGLSGQGRSRKLNFCGSHSWQVE